MEFISKEVRDVMVIWECEINKMLVRDKEMKQCFAEYLDEGPLDIRAAFMGGRTGALKHYHLAGPEETVEYFDVSSLYPTIKHFNYFYTNHYNI
jgi:hypothetical protein